MSFNKWPFQYDVRVRGRGGHCFFFLRKFQKPRSWYRLLLWKKKQDFQKLQNIVFFKSGSGGNLLLCSIVFSSVAFGGLFKRRIFKISKTQCFSNPPPPAAVAPLLLYKKQQCGDVAKTMTHNINVINTYPCVAKLMRTTLPSSISCTHRYRENFMRLIK